MRQLNVIGVDFRNLVLYVICRNEMEQKKIQEGLSDIKELISYCKGHDLKIHPTYKKDGLISKLQLSMMRSLLIKEDVFAQVEVYISALWSNPKTRHIVEKHRYFMEMKGFEDVMEEICSSY